MSIHLIAIFSLEIIAIVLGIYYRKVLPFAYRLMILQVALAFITEIFGLVISNVVHANNVWVYNMYMLFEIWLLGNISRYFLNNSTVKKCIAMILPILTLYWSISTYINGIFVFNNWFVVTAAFFNIICFVIVLFDNSIFSRKEIYKQPLFLVAISVIIYNASIIPLFGLLNYLVKVDANMADKLFYINISSAVLRYALIAIAFYLYGQQAKRGYVRQ